MAAVDVSVVASIYEFLLPMWVEVCFAVFFPLGWFLVNRFCLEQGQDGGQRPSKRPPSPAPGLRAIPFGPRAAQAERLHAVVEKEVQAGNPGRAVEAWHKAQGSVPANPKTLRLVVQALASVSPDTLVQEVTQHMEAHGATLRNSSVAAVVLDAAAHVRNPDLMEEIHDALRGQLGISPTCQMYEALLGGHAAAGNKARVDELCAEMGSWRPRLSARGYALIIKGFLQNGLLDAALAHMQSMRKQGYYVPPFALTMLFRVACEARRAPEILDMTEAEGVVLPGEALVILFEDCHKRGDLEFASRVEKTARAASSTASSGALLPAACYDPLLKTHVVAADSHAFDLLGEMLEGNVRISEGLWVGILVCCAEARYLRFAEEVVRHLRAKDGMTIATYSALMKVYAHCGYHGRACDLYKEIREQGMEPDAVMYGCLMKFAVECGRTELARELFELAPSMDIQNYMSLFKAAGRDKNVDEAFAVLRKLTSSGQAVDIAAYNCVLDVCVCAGDLTRARQLVREMKEIRPVDIITYNTLLKGYTGTGDLESAQELFKEMARDGLKPNETSYNCVINGAVSRGNFRQAWQVIDKMEREGVQMDKYTVSIMLKALKKDQDRREVQRTLGLLERSGLDVCSDEVLLNTAVETCIRHRETKRLVDLIDAFERSDLRPTLHAYASLIKANSVLQKPQRCRELWSEMVKHRALEPNEIVLGCMLDALVCNSLTEEAVQTFREWKDKVGTNMIMYSTLIKGFAAEGKAKEAMEMWREIRAEGGQMNTVVYNTLINAQARAGAVDEVMQLFASMESDKVTPDAITYSTIVKGHCVKGDLDKAFKVLRTMQKDGLASECVVYNTVLDACTKHNRMDLADIVLEDLERSNVTPSNFTLGILVKMYGRRRQLDKAFEVVSQLPAKWGFFANAQVKTCLMSACITNNALPRAWGVFEELKKTEAHAMDAQVYGVLLSGCVRAGHAEQAVQLVEEAYGLNGKTRALPRNQNLWTENLESLVKMLSSKGLQQQACALLTELRNAKVPVNGRLLTSLVSEATAGGGPNSPGRWRRPTVPAAKSRAAAA